VRSPQVTTGWSSGNRHSGGNPAPGFPVMNAISRAACSLQHSDGPAIPLTVTGVSQNAQSRVTVPGCLPPGAGTWLMIASSRVCGDTGAWQQGVSNPAASVPLSLCAGHLAACCRDARVQGARARTGG
jgi:hypothetical protein